jgi:hypothetical protein
LLIDHTHRKWFLGSAVGLAIATAVYVPYSLHAPQGPKGSSALGLTYGIAGFLFMLFAGLLGLRKKFPVWRVGRAQSWMRGHLWLGFLSFPLILFHGGFHFGGPLTRVLMWLFLFVFVSGILGTALQHFIPRIHTAQLPMETIYEQIDRVRGQLLEEAGELVEEACASLEGEVSRSSQQQRAMAAGAGANWDVTVASGLDADEGVSAELRQFLRDEMQPYLEKAGARRLALAEAARAQTMFRQMRVLLPPSLHPTVDDLENICEEKRGLDQQSRLHKILHGWLLVHIPLSYAVLLLGAVHAVIALKY